MVMWGSIKRDSSFELLRVVAIVLIIMGHFFSKGFGGYQINNRYNYLILFSLSNGARIAVNLFLMIGVWFMVDNEFKASRLLNLYGTVLGYSIVISSLLFWGGGELKAIQE